MHSRKYPHHRLHYLVLTVIYTTSVSWTTDGHMVNSNGVAAQ